MSQIGEFATAVGANVGHTRDAAAALAGSRERADELAATCVRLGLEDKAAEADAIGEELERIAAEQAALAERTERLRARVEALKGLAQTGGAPGSTGAVQPTPAPAGRWETPPRRHHGNEFNHRYERWVKVSNGGPDDEREYRVNNVWFDAHRFAAEDGQRAEILIDAKGRYDQFIDARRREWLNFFSASADTGLKGLEREAERQVAAANGRTVEWWCAERESARLIRSTLTQNRALRGRIQVRFEPMPAEER